MINLPELPALFRAVLKAAPGQAEARFTPGEVLDAKVLKALGKDAAMVRMRGLNLLASTNRPLTAGQTILVKVEQLMPNFTVSLLSHDTPVQEKTAGLLRMYLPQAMPTGDMLADLGRLMRALPRQALAGTNMEKVMEELSKAMEKEPGKEATKQNVLKLLGLNHEQEAAKGNRPQNLKSALMMVRANLERMEADTPGKFRDALASVNRSLQNLELRQLVNMDDKTRTTMWEIPFYNEGKEDTARLYVQKRKGGKKGGAEKEVETVSLMLEMSRLGPVRADMRRSGQTLEGEIYLGSEEAKAQVEQYLPHLITALEGLDFNARFNVLIAKKEFLTEQPEAQERLPVQGLLNVKA